MFVCPTVMSYFHLHDAVPVVSRWDPEEQQERHPKVSERGVASKTFTRVQFITYWGRSRELAKEGFYFILFYFIWHHDKQHPIVFPSPAIWTYWRDQWHNPAKGPRKQLTSNWFNSQMGKWRSRCMSVHALSGMFCLWVGVCTLSGLPVCILHVSLLRSPKSSTPSAAKMKKSSMKRRPRLPTCRETPANQCHIWNVCMH